MIETLKQPVGRKTLGRRLSLVPALVLFLTLVGSGIGVWSLYRVDQSTRNLVNLSLQTERIAIDALRLQAINSERYKAVALSSEPEVGEILGADIVATQQKYDALIKDLHRGVSDPKDIKLLEQIELAGRVFQAARTELIAARDSGVTERIRKVFSERFVPSSNSLQASLGELTKSTRKDIDESANEISQLSASARSALIAFGVAALLVGTALTVWLVRSITRPLRLAYMTANRVANLDLRQEITGHDRDETGVLLNSLSAMQDSLRGLVRQVRVSVESVSTASTEIASGNADLSQRTEEAAASLQQTAASMDSVSIMVSTSADAAARAEQMALKSTAMAADGGAVVSQVIGTMEDIKTSSHKITDIVGVIDNIAFQTNLLALNAAVEAARAGELGRGFSVVASEVRMLAIHSASAAREINGLVKKSVERVDAGSLLVGRAGQVMTQMVQSVRELTGAITEISIATRSQTEGIGLINASVMQLDQATQQNSALVEQSAAAAESLRQQSDELELLVSRFLLPARQATQTAILKIV